MLGAASVPEAEARERERKAFNMGALHEYEALIKIQERELHIEIDSTSKDHLSHAALVPFTESYRQRFDRRHKAADDTFPAPAKQRIVSGTHNNEFRVEHGHLQMRSVLGAGNRWVTAGAVWTEDVPVVAELLANPTERAD